METKNRTSEQLNYDENDLAGLLRQVWAGRNIIMITTAIFFVIAVLYLLYTTYSGVKEYESQATLYAESPSPDSLITITKSPLFISEVLKIKIVGLKTSPVLTVAEILNQQTSPPQGNLAGLTARINATKGNTGILVISVMMQDQSIVKQLADSIIQKLTQYLRQTQLKRAEKNQELLAKDTTNNFQVIREASSRNLLYLSKSTSNNIQFLEEGTAKDIQYLKKGSSKNIQFLNESSSKEIESQKQGSIQNIQFQKAGSAKNIQFLTEGYLKAESSYLESQRVLAEFYKRNSTNLQSIDSIEVKRLNSDIKLKYNAYSTLYIELEKAIIETKKLEEQVKLDAEKQLEQAKINADKQLVQAKLDVDKQIEQAKLNMDKQLEQAKLDASRQLEQAKIDAQKQLEQAKTDAENQIKKITIDAVIKVPVINVLEPATTAIDLRVTQTKKVLLLMVLFGVILGLGIVFGKNYWEKNFQNQN